MCPFELVYAVGVVWEGVEAVVVGYDGSFGGAGDEACECDAAAKFYEHLVSMGASVLPAQGFIYHKFGPRQIAIMRSELLASRRLLVLLESCGPCLCSS